MGSTRRCVMVLAIAGVCSACDGGGPRLMHREALATLHDYGVTECPQELGDIEVELSSSAPEAVTLAVGEDISAVDVLDPERGWPIPDNYTIDLYPGEVLVFPVQFNCGSTTDVAGSVVLETFAWSDGLPLESATIEVALEVRGP